jgi:PAS fold/HWE histidine kinase
MTRNPGYSLVYVWRADRPLRNCSRRKDGALVDISLTVSPVKDAHGEIVGAAKIARDITDRKRNDEHIATLAREAEHRTKNIPATVQATVNLSNSDMADGLKRAIEGRIHGSLNSTIYLSTRAGPALSFLASLAKSLPLILGAPKGVHKLMGRSCGSHQIRLRRLA